MNKIKSVLSLLLVLSILFSQSIALAGSTEVTLTFSANGGSGVPSTQYAEIGETITIPSSPRPSRTGYSFKGYSTSSTATSASYQPGGSITMNSNRRLYAVWSINRYTFTFNANGGYGAPSSISGNYNSTVAIPVVVPQRTGYNFQGWGTSSTTTTVSYTIGGNYTITSSKTLYAVWVAKPICTLSFSANGGSGAPPSIQDYQGASVPIPSSSINRTGYSFLGWSTSSTATAATYRTNDNFPLLCDQTLYAVWSINRYTFTFNANGGYGAPSSISGDYNSTVTIPIVVPQRTGYNFQGWGTSSTTTTVSYTIGGNYTITSSKTLYAVWVAKPICTLSFNANGGSGAPPSIQDYQDTFVPLPAGRPSRTGYSFQGWSTSPTATSAPFHESENYKLLCDETLYAVWSINNYTFTFDANGGSGAPYPIYGNYNTTVTIPIVIPQRTGYNFQGWGTTSDSTTVAYTIGGNYTITSSKTLYAVWLIKPICTLTFNANGGIGAPPSIQDYQDTFVPIPSSSISKIGHSFLGWSTSPTATAATYKTNDNFPLLCDDTLYAVWKKNTYTLHLDGNGGSVAPADYNGLFGDTITLPTITKQYRVFIGWDINPNSTNPQFKPGVTYTFVDNLTLCACWRRYQVNYYDGATKILTEGMEVQYGYALVTGPAYREGYQLQLWWDKDTYQCYEIGEVFKQERDLNVFAIWDRYTVSYKANAGEDNVQVPEDQTKLMGVVLKLSTFRPERVDYDFEGWSYNNNGSIFIPGALLYDEADVTFYAKWKPHTYTVNFNPGENGTVNVSSRTKTIGANLDISDITAVKDGYKFMGWYESGIPTRYTHTITNDLKRDVTTHEAELIAEWEPEGGLFDYVTVNTLRSNGQAIEYSLTVNNLEPGSQIVIYLGSTHRTAWDEECVLVIDSNGTYSGTKYPSMYGPIQVFGEVNGEFFSRDDLGMPVIVYPKGNTLEIPITQEDVNRQTFTKSAVANVGAVSSFALSFAPGWVDKVIQGAGILLNIFNTESGYSIPELVAGQTYVFTYRYDQSGGYQRLTIKNPDGTINTRFDEEQLASYEW